MAQVRILHQFKGSAYGLRQQTFIMQVAFSVPPDVCWADVDHRIETALKDKSLRIDPRLHERYPFVSRLIGLAACLQERANIPIFETSIVLETSGTMASAKAILAVPQAPGRFDAAINALEWASYVMRLVVERNSDFKAICIDIGAETERILSKLQESAPKNDNTMRYLSAAHKAHVPWAHVANDIYQFGWGAKARLMNGSLTDKTAMIGVRLAGNKYAGAETLRRVGLPAPTHSYAGSADDAVTIADAMGYPVVVKPADLDGGIGVAAGLGTPEQVRRSFNLASRYSQNILVEKHAFGQDYRLTVFNGELIWAVHRQPGGVVGDGVHTIRELTALLNTDPRRGDTAFFSLKPLRLDDEASELALEAGMSLESIPARSTFVTLRRAANISSGGTPVAILDHVHPDNKQLALDVAAAMSLDLIGIDLIMEDIARSWHDVGATICEVNADPQLVSSTQQHLYGQIIQSLCKGTGRIPIVVLCGTAKAVNMAEDLQKYFSAHNFAVGTARAHASIINGRVLRRHVDDIFVSAQSLLSHRRPNMIIVLLEEHYDLQTSLPFDYIDALAFLDETVAITPMRQLVFMLGPNAHSVIVDTELAPRFDVVAPDMRAKIKIVSSVEECFDTLIAVIAERLYQT